ncbi:hypothetical protein OCB09_00245 [Bacillus cereus]|nr:hypothetical protein [Bacillus cereus]
MTQDKAILKAKGHVKLELYNDKGVFYKKEKKNLVVQSANEVVANMMADPAKQLRVKQSDKGASAVSANSRALYPFALSVQHEEIVQVDMDWGSTNAQTEFQLDSLKDLVSLSSVKVGETELVIDEHVFVTDEVLGKVKFTTAPTEKVVFKFRKIKNPYMKVISGTEKVTVAGVEWQRASVANHEARKYQVDYLTGEILFQTPVTNVKVDYDYNMRYCLGFMALGGKPTANHPNYQPVEYGNSNRLDTFMRNELSGSRMPVYYPATISNGATEIEPAIPTQPIANVSKTNTIAITDNGDGSTKKLVYNLQNLHDSGSGLTGRKLLEIISVRNVTANTDIKANVSVVTNETSGVSIRFADSDITIGHTVQVEYRLKLDNRHLIYQLGQAPVVKLVAVRHIDAIDSTNVREYNIVQDGLRPSQGDVWVSNPNTGHITFSSEPTGGPKVHTPGQIQVEYMVNSGTTVKFIADFPKGTPAPSIEKTKKVVTVGAGQTSIILDAAIAKEENGAFIVPEVIVNHSGTTKTLESNEYTISLDGKTITPNSISTGDIVTINHSYEKTTHDVYQVAMFDEKVDGKMFNISGIGPVTKDKNTGMRITWSVTF